ncbi:Transmembrane protein 50 [Glycine max]|nr:Transmembrane protein 50 [Glycine max]
MDLLELWAIFGPGVAGAVFGAGWWIWLDAVVCSLVTVPFLHYLPGIFASFAALMFNCVRKEDIDYSPYDEGEWRLKLWLFIAYVVSFVSLAGSAGLLIQDSLDKSAPSVWTGVAVDWYIGLLILNKLHQDMTRSFKLYQSLASCKSVNVNCANNLEPLGRFISLVSRLVLTSMKIPPTPRFLSSLNSQHTGKETLYGYN